MKEMRMTEKVPVSGNVHDYSVSWKYIVDEMERRGFDTESTELHEFSFFSRMLELIWEDYFGKMYAMEGELDDTHQRRLVY